VSIHEETIQNLEQLDIETIEETDDIDVREIAVAWGRGWCRNTNGPF